ncbi:hypothetical protein DSO57_1021043 [Entomophthora muscae]|uniref:Uncharacterized protein n=1 Tax=Entomophthora muscae TaxID=34485 RepID=A0ACC2SGA2_9FUNG|nr:hypothetical protein DSO57_1021043 [Entomophthora muscae]
MDATELETLEKFNVALNIASGGCGLLVVVLLAGLKVLQPRAMDRVSIRFTLVISLVDFAKAAVIAMYAVLHADDYRCVALAFGTQWLTLVYLGLNVTIALNLKRVFVDGRNFNPKWERQYWLGAFLIPTLILSIPLSKCLLF